jgi:ribonuclease HI
MPRGSRCSEKSARSARLGRVALLHQHYLVYGDGSCIGNPGPGGWGVIVHDPAGDVSEFNGHDPRTTNNRMELTAAIEGLRATPPESHVVFRSDSQYVVKTVTDGWKRNANQDLWRKLDDELVARTVRFEWVRGHDTDPINNRADKLALMGAHGKLLADAAADDATPDKDASPEKAPARRSPRSRSSAGESEDLARLTPLLEPGESIRECASCGAKFVSSREGDDYCSQARCQLKARNR